MNLLSTADPAQPLITYYDDATGERTELSAATLGNWVAKAANLLLDVDAQTCGVLLPPHWQTAGILLGAWTAGLSVSHGPAPVDVVFSTVGRLGEVSAWGSPEVYAVSVHPFALPLTDLPAGVADYVTEARTHGDFYVGPPPPPAAPALTGLPRPLSHADLLEHAKARAAELGLTAADRIMITDPKRPLDWLLAPLSVGASVVLVANPDAAALDARAASEKVTRRL